MTTPLVPRPVYRDRFVRHECKYLISERSLGDILRFIAPYVAHDPYSAELGSYTVNSLYFDTSDLRLYRETVEGIGQRFKLRARSYGLAAAASSDPVFLEIKRRDNALVYKTRARISGQLFRDLVNGRAPDVDQLPASALGCYDEFVTWIARLGAHPTMYVRYEREAWVGVYQEGVRVTVDRELRCASALAGIDQDPSELDWSDVEPRWLVFELKFDVAFPPWMGELVRRFELRRTSFSKYGNSVLRSTDPLLRCLA